MKTLLLIVLVLTVLGGCVVTPVGPGYPYGYGYDRYGYGYPYDAPGYSYHYGYYRNRSYWRQAP